MFDRVEKIEQVARVKGVTNDNRHRFDSGRRRNEEGNSFADELRRAMNKKASPVKTAKKIIEVPEAYDLELTNCGTHSLFYMSNLSLDRLLATT